MTNSDVNRAAIGKAEQPMISPRMVARIRMFGLRTAFLVAFLLAWEFASGPLIQPFFISKPSEIAGVLWVWIADGTLFFHASITAVEAVSGFILGGAAGIILGTVLGRSQLASDLLEPFIMAFYSLPKVALAPLFVMWLGIGITMKIVLTAAVVFFLVFLNTYTGVRSVSRELVVIMKLMSAKERHLLTKVVIPSALSWVFAGLRISVPYALIGAIVGELIASNRGLGFLLSSSAGQFFTAGVFAALAATIVLAALLNIAVKVIEKKLAPWKLAEADREMSV